MAQDYKWRGIAGDYVELSDQFFLAVLVAVAV